MTNIFLDVEAIPGQQQWLAEEIRASLSAPSNYKDPEKIQAYIDEAFVTAMNKTVFDGAYAHIICVSVAADDADPVSFYAETPQQERDLLVRLNNHLASDFGSHQYAKKVYIGHNVQGFDLPMIRKRSMILGVEPHPSIPFDGKPWDNNPWDTMLRWDAKNYCGLDKLLKAFGLGDKGDVNGSMVYDMWKAGRHDEIQKYCELDVMNVRKLYKKMSYEDKQDYTAQALSSVATAEQPQKPKRLNL